MNEQLDEINSALSKLGFKAPNEEKSDSYVQNIKKVQTEISSLNSQFAELQSQIAEQSSNRRQVFKSIPWAYTGLKLVR